MTDRRTPEPVEWFDPTSGRLVGSLGILGCLVSIVLIVLDGLGGADLPVIVGLVLAAALIWTAILRPRIGVTPRDLVLRNMLRDTHVPLASIEQIGVRTVTAVRAGERRFVSPGVGRSLRSIRKRAGQDPDPTAHYADFVEARIRQRMDDARAVAGVRPRSDEQAALADGVRREWARPEALALAVLALALVVSIVLH